LNLYEFVENDSIVNYDELGLVVGSSHYVAFNPAPDWLYQFDNEGNSCCCQSSPQVTLTMTDMGTSWWTIQILANVQYSGCVSEMRWAWSSCDRYTSMSSSAPGQGGFFTDYGPSIVNFKEKLAPRPILQIWLHAVWLECNKGTWTKKEGSTGLSYDAVWGISWVPVVGSTTAKYN
jgi:hypothetical protein